MSTKTVFCFFSATILLGFPLSGCGEAVIASVPPVIIEEIPETNDTYYSFDSIGFSTDFGGEIEGNQDAEIYNPFSELNEAQLFLINSGFLIDEVNYSDNYEGQNCSWFHFGNADGDGGVIYCDDIFYIDYAVFLDDGTLGAAESLRCSPGELIKILAEIVNEEPS